MLHEQQSMWLKLLIIAKGIENDQKGMHIFVKLKTFSTVYSHDGLVTQF